jgi:dTMP kinase
LFLLQIFRKTGMKFIVIEGLDGSGKTTQLNLVEDYLQKQKIKSKFLHFPRNDAPFFGEMIYTLPEGRIRSH